MKVISSRSDCIRHIAHTLQDRRVLVRIFFIYGSCSLLVNKSVLNTSGQLIDVHGAQNKFVLIILALSLFKFNNGFSVALRTESVVISVDVFKTPKK